jgi:hypothetical protein
MNDNVIISAISTIHRAIVSLALFIFLVGSSLFFTLKDGLFLNHLDLPGLEVEKLYIKWDEKLEIAAERAYVTKSNGREDAPFDYAAIAKTLRMVGAFKTYVASVDIAELHLDGASGSFSFNAGKTNEIALDSEGYRLHAGIRFIGDYFRLDLKTFEDKNRRVKLSGSVVTDLQQDDIFADMNISFADIDGIRFYGHADRGALAFSVKTANPLTDIRPIIDSTGLPQKISKWIVDYGKSRSIVLHSLHGSIPYNDPKALLKNLYAAATCYQLSYRFHQKLEPIHTEKTELHFENGVLNILPKQARFYGHDGGESWLNIDFTAPKTTLNAFIRTDAPLDENMLNLLRTYRIDLPFKQLEGVTRADLTLAIILATAHTEAKGRFLVDSGRFSYMGLDLGVSDASVGLVGADVAIDTLSLDYDNRLKAELTGTLNPVKKHGSLRLTTGKASFGDGNRTIALVQEQPLHVDYIITPGQDRILFEPSRWRHRGIDIAVDAAAVPFDYSASTATLDRVPFRINSAVSATASGAINFKQESADLLFRVQELHYESLRLDQPQMTLTARYDKTLRLSHPDPTTFDIGGSKLRIGTAAFDINASQTHTSAIDLRLGEAVHADFSFTLEHETGSADLFVTTLEMEHNATGARFSNRYPLTAIASLNEAGFYLGCNDPQLYFGLDASGWELDLFSLSSLSKHLPLLRRYALDEGEVRLEHAKDAPDYRFGGSLNLLYPMLVQNEEPVTAYSFEGNTTDGFTRMRINDALHVDINKTVQVTTEGVGFNLGAIINYINATTQTKNGGRAPVFTLDAANSYIYLTPQRRAEADTIHLQSSDGVLDARLTHGSGNAVFKLDQGLFSLHGENFGDRFMRRLLSLAEYRGGSMSFHVNGTTTNAHGIVHVQDTVVKDYRALNNILAFINTVPSLATFSLPHYSDKGLEVSDAHASFHYDNGLVSVDGLNVDSHEIDIIGSGTVDYINSTIDMQLNLITDAGENISKIPLVGYILVGERGDVTTTLKIEGDLENPKVTNDIAENIVISPFKMLMRTITLPLKILELPEKKSEKK